MNPSRTHGLVSFPIDVKFGEAAMEPARAPGVNVRELLVAPVRRALHDGAARWPWFRRIVSVGARELERALHDDLYPTATSASRAAPEVALEIGTPEYTRTATHADEGAYLVWRFLPVQQHARRRLRVRVLRRGRTRARARRDAAST